MYLILYYLKNPIVNHNIIRNWQDRYLCDLVSSSNQIIDRSKLSATKKNYKKKNNNKRTTTTKKKKNNKKTQKPNKQKDVRLKLPYIERLVISCI